jgi:prepilin-type N-terminal cleavage/methylation domain-containing protein
MAAPKQNPDGRDAGFTLLEILVGLAISSLIMVGLTAAMQTVDRGWTRTTESVERQATLASGFHVLAGDIARIERAIAAGGGTPGFLFAGTASEAIFVLAERPGNNRAGLYWVRLQVRERDGANELVRMRAPFVSGRQNVPAIAWADEVILIRGNIAVEMTYRSPRAGLRSWSTSWPAGNRLPEQIKIEITNRKTGRWLAPAMVMTLAIDAEAACFNADSTSCTMKTEGALTGGTRGNE